MAVGAPLVEMRGAAFRYGRHMVFEDLDLDVMRGEVLTVLGPNGCGKSTLLRCIGGALPLSHGAIRFDSVELSTLDVTQRARKIGFLFQRHSPSFPFPVLDVVMMGRTPHLAPLANPTAQDRQIAEDALVQVGMRDLADRPYTELSGGELQLVLLARALAQRPEVILLDEPTSHLDFKNQVRSLKAIGALAERGVTMVMSTHDPNHACLLPGRAALLGPAGKVLVGTAAEVITGETLSAIYGIDISVRPMPRCGDAGEIRICSPW
jgi:iron complex transport system ATP-binding protein